MKRIFRENLFFLIPYSVFIIIAFTVIIFGSKAETHLFLNSFHNPVLDFFFQYWTHTGNGFFALFITLILLFYKYRWAIISAVSNIFIGLIVQSLKRWAFEDIFRPVLWFRTYFENSYDLNIVEGAEPGWYYSFPSGHTATAFGIFFLLSMFAKKNMNKLIYFILALLAGYSRIYLSWHFLEDALAGSFIGVIISLLIYLVFKPKDQTKLDGSLLKSIKKSDK